MLSRALLEQPSKRSYVHLRIQFSLLNEGDVINPKSYIYKIMSNQQNDLLREKLKLKLYGLHINSSRRETLLAFTVLQI